MKTSLSAIQQQLKDNKSYLVPLALYTFLFLFFCSKLSPLYPTNEWGDINVYFNVGKGVFDGMTLYSEIFDHKGPLIFFIYGLGSLLSTSSYIGVFLIFLVLWVVAVFAIFFTAKLFIKDSSAFILSLILPISYLTYMYMGGSAEELALLLSAISLYFFMAYFVQEEIQHKPYYMLVHGVLSSITFLIKLNLIIFWFFPLLFIFIHLLYRKEFKNFFQNCLAYLAGFALIFVPVCLYFVFNGAFEEAYHVYIKLNSQYASSSNYAYMVANGFRKLFTDYRAHLVWYIIITIGLLYFPFRFLKNKFLAGSILLSGGSLILSIFFPLTFHFYYPLPLLVFVTLGLIAIFSFLERYITIDTRKKLIYFAVTFTLLIAINQVDFFGMGGKNILRLEYPTEPQFGFKDIIKVEEDQTLLNLSFMEGNALFTTTGITPSVKYFFCPNIYYEMYPDIRDNQAKYIENKETMFVIDCSVGFNSEFFKSFEPLQENYSLIDSLTMKDKTFYLYKRK